MSSWSRVTRDMPCPVCGKPDWCSITPRGGVKCMRVESLIPHTGGWIHDVNEDLHLKYQDSFRVTHSEPRGDLPELVESYVSHPDAPHRLWVLAQQLGVPLPLLREWQVGWAGKAWSMPERGPTGEYTGISLRDPAGRKYMVKGSKHGLFYHPRWDRHAGPILLPEGFTDAVTLDALGISALGRPSSLGGAAYIVSMMRDRWSKRDIIVMAERDAKDDGRCPGMDGARFMAKKILKEMIPPFVYPRVLLPPDGAKDIRAWLDLREPSPSLRLELLGGLTDV